MSTATSIDPSSNEAVEGLTYEQAMAELENIVAALESGDHALDAALSLYERGQALARHCTQLLDRAELKIQSLSGEDLVNFDQQ